MQTMEIDRIVEMEKFIQTYANAVQTLGETMNQVSRDHVLHKDQSIIKHITSSDLSSDIRGKRNQHRSSLVLDQSSAAFSPHHARGRYCSRSEAQCANHRNRDSSLRYLRKSRHALVSSWMIFFASYEGRTGRQCHESRTTHPECDALDTNVEARY